MVLTRVRFLKLSPALVFNAGMDYIYIKVLAHNEYKLNTRVDTKHGSHTRGHMSGGGRPLTASVAGRSIRPGPPHAG